MPLKRWIYWCVVSDECVLALTLADLGYLGLAAASLLDAGSGRFIERAVALPLGLGLRLPDAVRADVSFARFGLSIEFREAPEGTLLRTAFRRRGEQVRAEALALRAPHDEPLTVLVPFSDTRQHLTSKHVALPARGEARAGSRAFELGARTRAFAFLDYGRGVWPYRTRWQWACAAGEEGGRTLGLNLGGAWTRGTGVTENALFVDGRVEKISGELEFELDERGVPRRIRSAPGAAEQVDLAFAAERQRLVSVNLLALSSRLAWGLGSFSGTVSTPSGGRYELRGLRGFAEDHAARW